MTLPPPEPQTGAGAETALETEKQLVAALRQGREEAFETLVRTHATRLLAVTRRILPGEEDARDALQDAFLSAFRAMERFDGKSRLYTWLYRIAVNAALMRARTRSRRPEESIEELLPRFAENGMHREPVRAWGEPVRAAQIRELRGTVRDAIEHLPESHRNVLILRDIEGLSTAETAELLETTPNAVKVRLHRARQALRTLLDPHLAPSGE